MDEFHRASHERVNAFEVDGELVFKEYFTDRDLFDDLRRYYDGNQYRFEVPEENFDAVREHLAEAGFGLVRVEDVDPFVVAVRMYTAHPKRIFKDSVAHHSSKGYNFFLMDSEDAVEYAVRNGAKRAEDVGPPHPF